MRRGRADGRAGDGRAREGSVNTPTTVKVFPWARPRLLRVHSDDLCTKSRGRLGPLCSIVH